MHYGPTPFKYMHFTVRTQTYKLVSPNDFPHGILYQPKDDQLKEVLSNLELYNIEEDPSERIDLAKKYPEIVEDLLAKYENWFDEVTQERDAKGIQRIYLGETATPEVNLSRFDWGGPRVISENELGFWRVRTEAGIYDISMDLPEVIADGLAHIKYQNVHKTLAIIKGQKQIIFKNISLPSGVGNFQAFFKSNRLATGPLFVTIKRIDVLP